MVDPVIENILLILFGGLLSFFPYFIKHNIEEKRHRDNLLRGIVSNVISIKKSMVFVEREIELNESNKKECNDPIR